MDKGVIIMKNKISLRKIRIQCAMKTYSTIKKMQVSQHNTSLVQKDILFESRLQKNILFWNSWISDVSNINILLAVTHIFGGPPSHSEVIMRKYNR